LKIKKIGVNIEPCSKKNRVTLNPKFLFPVIMKVPHSERQPRGKKQVQTLSRLARQAARISTEKSGLEISEFSKNEDGVPIPTNGIYWSISHKSLYVGGVVSIEPVGFDIERVRPVKNRVMEKIASEGEWALAGGKALETFFRFWTAKEAVLKATGAGFAGLSNCRIVEIDDDKHLVAKYNEKRFIIHQTWCAKAYIAAVTGTERSVRWVFV
jgi:4'-phosphopantetheinyl transferase